MIKIKLIKKERNETKSNQQKNVGGDVDDDKTKDEK